MQSRRVWIALVAAAWIATATAQSGRRTAGMDQLPDEFYFTRPMVQFAIDRMTEQMQQQLGLDPEQLELTRAQLEEALPRFLVENREEIQPVVNEFMGMMANRESPPAEKVAEWSSRALPAFDKFQGMLTETADGMREFLTEEQNVLLDGNLAALDVAAGYTRTRLQTWNEGGYDAAIDWHRAPGHQKAMKAEEQMVKAEQDYAAAIARGDPNPPVPAHLREDGAWPPAQTAAGVPSATTPGSGAAAGGATGGDGARAGSSDRPVVPAGRSTAAAARDEWAEYVAAFCDRYQLNPEQRQKAQQFLRDAQSQRDSWKSKTAERRAKLEQLAAGASTETGKAAAAQKIKDLEAPFERHFERLKQRLEKLPTPAQRAAATQTAATATAKPESP